MFGCSQVDVVCWDDYGGALAETLSPGDLVILDFTTEKNYVQKELNDYQARRPAAPFPAHHARYA
jgi:hypothetical protein